MEDINTTLKQKMISPYITPEIYKRKVEKNNLTYQNLNKQREFIVKFANLPYIKYFFEIMEFSEINKFDYNTLSDWELTNKKLKPKTDWSKNKIEYLKSKFRSDDISIEYNKNINISITFKRKKISTLHIYYNFKNPNLYIHDIKNKIIYGGRFYNHPLNTLVLIETPIKLKDIPSFLNTETIKGYLFYIHEDSINYTDPQNNILIEYNFDSESYIMDNSNEFEKTYSFNNNIPNLFHFDNAERKKRFKYYTKFLTFTFYSEEYTTIQECTIYFDPTNFIEFFKGHLYLNIEKNIPILETDEIPNTYPQNLTGYPHDLCIFKLGEIELECNLNHGNIVKDVTVQINTINGIIFAYIYDINNNTYDISNFLLVVTELTPITNKIISNNADISKLKNRLISNNIKDYTLIQFDDKMHAVDETIFDQLFRILSSFRNIEFKVPTFEENPTHKIKYEFKFQFKNDFENSNDFIFETIVFDIDTIYLSDKKESDYIPTHAHKPQGDWFIKTLYKKILHFTLGTDTKCLINNMKSGIMSAIFNNEPFPTTIIDFYRFLPEKLYPSCFNCDDFDYLKKMPEIAYSINPIHNLAVKYVTPLQTNFNDKCRIFLNFIYLNIISNYVDLTQEIDIINSDITNEKLLNILTHQPIHKKLVPGQETQLNSTIDKFKFLIDKLKNEYDALKEEYTISLPNDVDKYKIAVLDELNHIYSFSYKLLFLIYHINNLEEIFKISPLTTPSNTYFLIEINSYKNKIKRSKNNIKKPRAKTFIQTLFTPYRTKKVKINGNIQTEIFINPNAPIKIIYLDDEIDKYIKTNYLIKK